MRCRSVLLGFLSAAAVACGAPAAAPSDCAEVLAPDAWVGADPPRWVELWRSGGAESEVELAVPIMIQPAPDGRLAIADFQLGLGGLGPDGEWIGPLTRPGEGPGEVGSPLAASYADDGTLAILDFMGGKVVFLDRDGGLVREFPIDPAPLSQVMMSGELHGLGLTADGTTLLIVREVVREELSVRQALLRLPADGGTADTIATATVPALGGDFHHETAPGWPRLVSAAAPDGRIAYAGHEAGYEIVILTPDGARSDVCRPVEPETIRQDELLAPRGMRPHRRRSYEEALSAAPRPDRPAAISRLLFGRGGRLWVERERFGRQDGGAAFTGRPGSTFDVFDADGRFLGETGAPDGVHVMAATGDTVWGLRYDAFDVPSVIAFRLARQGTAAR